MMRNKILTESRKRASIKRQLVGLTAVLLFGMVFMIGGSQISHAQAPTTCNDGTPISAADIAAKKQDTVCAGHGGYVRTSNDSGAQHQCGSGNKYRVKTSINFGCTGEVCISNPADAYCQSDHNPIIDALFAIIRFLSVGVGIVVIASIVVAGIQFTTSRGDPNATAKAIERIRSSVIALLVYIFAFALLNYIIPNGFFR